MFKIRNMFKRKNANDTATVIEGTSATKFTSNNMPLNVGKVTITLDDNDTIMNDIESLAKNVPTPKRENDCLTEKEAEELTVIHSESMNDVDIETEDNVLTMEEVGDIDEVPMKKDNVFEEENIVEGEYGKVSNNDNDEDKEEECGEEYGGDEEGSHTCARCGGSEKEREGIAKSLKMTPFQTENEILYSRKFNDFSAILTFSLKSNLFSSAEIKMSLSPDSSTKIGLIEDFEKCYDFLITVITEFYTSGFALGFLPPNLSPNSVPEYLTALKYCSPCDARYDCDLSNSWCSKASNSICSIREQLEER